MLFILHHCEFSSFKTKHHLPCSLSYIGQAEVVLLLQQDTFHGNVREMLSPFLPVGARSYSPVWIDSIGEIALHILNLSILLTILLFIY